MLTTADEVVDALGGTAATARIFGVVPSAVSNWKKDGRFPARLHYRLAKLAEARKLKIAPSFFEEPA